MDVTRTLVGSVPMATLVALIGCGGTDTVRHDPIVIDEAASTRAEDDAATIRTATLTDNILQLRVVHAGGLKEHEFSLYGSLFMESNPVQVNVYLSHAARGDLGEALIARDLSFDLSPLKRAYRDAYREDGPIILRIHEPGSSTPSTTVLRYE